MYPLVICYIAIENGHRNSGFTMIYPLKMVIFHSYVNVYKRVHAELWKFMKILWPLVTEGHPWPLLWSQRHRTAQDATEVPPSGSVTRWSAWTTPSGSHQGWRLWGRWNMRWLPVDKTKNDEKWITLGYFWDILDIESYQNYQIINPLGSIDVNSFCSQIKL